MKNMCAVKAHENRNQMQMATLDKGRKDANSVKCAKSNKSTEGSQQQRCIILLAFVLLFMPDLIVALKDVSVTIPQAVKRGSNAQLTCNYDMENDTLYSVKWYKGRREFYRYTPKENPAMKVFAMTSGLNVERNLSNQSHVVLQSVPLNISGKFTCEISVEAPSFQTAMVSGEMEVVELPEDHTTVTGIQARYRIGDLVDGNCSIKYSKPAANLTWTINGIVVPPHHIKTYQIEKHENSSLESVMSAIHFMVTTQHFLKGQMRLKCTASLFDIFKEEIESVIEEDRPRIMASGRSYDMNNYPFDQHSSGDGFEDHNESYLTYYSQNAGSAASNAPQIFWQPWFRRLQLYTKRLQRSSKQITALLQHSWSKRTVDNSKAFAKSNGNNNMAVEKEDSVELKPLCISCNQIDVWQLSIYAAVAAIGLTTTHQIINCQYKGLCTAEDGKHSSSSSSSSSPTSLSTTTLISKSERALLVETTIATLSNANARKCFAKCQIATISMQKRCCYFVECQQLGVQQLCCRTQHHHQRCRHGNQNYGNASSIENGNDLTATATEQECQQQLSARCVHVTPTDFGAKMASTTATTNTEAQPAAWDQRLLMTSKSTLTIKKLIKMMLMLMLLISC